MTFMFILPRAAACATIQPRIFKYFMNVKASRQPWKDYFHITAWNTGKSRSLPWVIKQDLWQSPETRAQRDLIARKNFPFQHLSTTYMSELLHTQLLGLQNPAS